MTIIKKVETSTKGYFYYRVWVNGQVRYCDLEEVLYILSTEEED